VDLTTKDIERLKNILESIKKGTASTYDKNDNIAALEAILDPKCAVCRNSITGEMIVLNDRKMHPKCSTRYNK
jgi:hypothetical protein